MSVLTETELKAKMYDVLINLHTNHPKILWNVHSERTQNTKESTPDSNRILVRGSFHKNDGIEMAAIEYLDATSPALDDLTHDLGLGFEADYERKYFVKGKVQ